MAFNTGRRNYGRNHGYRLDGRKVKGVTTLIGGGLPKPALINWMGRSVAEYAIDSYDQLGIMLEGTGGRGAAVKWLMDFPRAERDAAADRGTEVHSYAEKLNRGEDVTPPDEIRGHVENYHQFLVDFEPEIHEVERYVFHRGYAYGGTFDLVADIDIGNGPETGLWDLKTNTKDIYHDVVLQLSAYRYAEFYVSENDGNEHPMADLGITRTGVIWVRADGYDLIPIDTDEDTFATFLYAAAVARQADSKWPEPSLLQERIGEAIQLRSARQ